MAGSGEGTYKFTLGDVLLKKAQDELSEKDKWRARDIEAVREKIKAHKGRFPFWGKLWMKDFPTFKRKISRAIGQAAPYSRFDVTVSTFKN